MIIKIHDTGYVNDEFGVSDVPFGIFSTSTSSQKKRGHFRANNTLELKILGFTPNYTKTGFFVPNRTQIQGKHVNIALDEIQFNIQVLINKPLMGLHTNTLDLNDYKELLIMSFSKGHKDLYIVSNTTPDNSALLPLNTFIELFGKEDNGNPDNAKHLNFDIKAVNAPDNAGEGKIIVTLDCVLLPYFG